MPCDGGEPKETRRKKSLASIILPPSLVSLRCFARTHCLDVYTPVLAYAMRSLSAVVVAAM